MPRQKGWPDESSAPDHFSRLAIGTPQLTSGQCQTAFHTESAVQTTENSGNLAVSRICGVSGFCQSARSVGLRGRYRPVAFPKIRSPRPENSGPKMRNCVRHLELGRFRAARYPTLGRKTRRICARCGASLSPAFRYSPGASENRRKAAADLFQAAWRPARRRSISISSSSAQRVRASFR